MEFDILSDGESISRYDGEKCLLVAQTERGTEVIVKGEQPMLMAHAMVVTLRYLLEHGYHGLAMKAIEKLFEQLEGKRGSSDGE